MTASRRLAAIVLTDSVGYWNIFTGEVRIIIDTREGKMKSDPRSTGHLVPLLRAFSLFIAIGLFGGGFSGVWLANAQQTDKKTEMKMEMATTGIFDGVGEIIALVPEKTQVVVGHVCSTR